MEDWRVGMLEEWGVGGLEFWGCTCKKVIELRQGNPTNFIILFSDKRTG